MASFQKRGKTWQYTVSRIIDGKSSPIRKSGFKTKKEAQVAASMIEEQIRSGTSLIKKPISFAEYLKDWINLYKMTKHTNTLNRYLNSYENVLKYFGDKSIQDITKVSYQSFLNEFGKTHAKDTTRKLNTHIRSCVKDAVDEGLIKVDFTRKAEFSGTNKTKKPSEKHLDLGESEKLMNELLIRLDYKKPMNYLILLALGTGMRFGELVGLTRKDFLFKESVIDINKTWDYKNGTGFGPTKNDGGSDRVIKVAEVIMDVFEEWFENTPPHFKGLIFHSSQSANGVLTNEATNKALRLLLKELDISHITMHGLRHTFGSILLYEGLSFLYVSEHLGHASPDITTSVYSHILKETRERDAQKAADIFNGMKKLSV